MKLYPLTAITEAVTEINLALSRRGLRLEHDPAGNLAVLAAKRSLAADEHGERLPVHVDSFGLIEVDVRG